ncbi:MAG: hypothetical protein HFH97_04600 [Lachnospiraceae bacterium]|nr:MBG domain-containing protein [uncultured Acetatifactor sp.]MCI9571881.1 hypothetical protein [Lachnospiraceae bacterium]
MRGRKHWWKCVLVLLLSVALIGSSVDYAMLSASAQEADRGGIQEEKVPSEETEPESKGILSAVPLEPDDADSEGPDAEEPENADQKTLDGEEPDGANSGDTGEEKPDETVPEGLGEKDQVGSGVEEPEEGKSDDADSEEPGEGLQEINPEDARKDAPDEDVAGELESSEVVVVPEIDMPGNDELFEGYIAQLFYGDSGVSVYGSVGADRLPEGAAKDIYNALKSNIQAVANGSRTSTEFDLGEITFAGAATNADALAKLNQIMENILSYLLMDCPYELYWFNKSTEDAMMYRSSYYPNQPEKLMVKVSFIVADEYQGSNQYEVKSDEVTKATAAAAKAKKIVNEYAAKPDYEKLRAYMEEICNLVSYNYGAADEATNTAYGNPWQLVWVFDGDANTNVVCEGYSKAFQYLCDLSDFNNAVCYTVTGTMAGGTGAGPHMWNIVTLDGKNYLVDVTNCDGDSIGAPDMLFLAGASGSVADGYTCNFNNRYGQASSIKYTYDAKEVGLFGTGILTLAGENYKYKGTLKVTAPDNVEVTFGDEVSDSVLKGGSATGVDGVVAGTFKWDTSVTSYGEAGTSTLKAIFVPDAGTGYASVSINVTVTVNRKPITVTADAKTKTYGSADPVLTYSAPDVVAGYPLSGELARVAGEDVNAEGYTISQGTVTNDKNPNYNISFTESKLKITPASCTETVEKKQNVLLGVGDFREPTYTGVDGKPVGGDTTYSYDNQSDMTYEALKAKLAALQENATGEIGYTFRPDTPNYNSVTGKITFTVRDIVFLVGTTPATASNAVTLKSGAAYGDSWSDIVTIGALTAEAGTGRDDDQGHFTLRETGMPNAGENQSFAVLYNGTVGGKTYKDVIVCTGTVNINRRIVTVAAGSYQVSKVYDKTTKAGKATGELALSNILQKDMDGVTVKAEPGDYTNPNVGGQNTVKVNLTMSGTASGNYSLSNSTLDVPCEIRPMSITPTLEPLGSYDYTGKAITPELTVKNGDEAMAASDYEAVWSNNVNAGTAKVAVKPAAGGNYTWSGTVETTFAINKVAYTGETTKSVSVRFGGELTLDMASLLPEGYQLGEITVADEEHIFEGAPSMAGTTLSGKLVNDKENAGKTAVITVPVTKSTNFLAFDFTVTVVVSNKMEQANFGFSSPVLNKVYGDSDFTLSVSNAAQGSKVTYTSSNPDVAQVDEAGNVRILGAGTAGIQAQASETDEYFSATASCILNVIPRMLAWDVEGLSAVDKEGAMNGNKATLYGELRVSGILEGDKADVVFSCPASRLTGTYAAVNAGIQKVTLAWADPKNPAVLQGSKAGNYRLPETLPGFTGRINAVNSNLATPPESGAGVQYSLSMETGISQVPQAFLALENLNTPEKIEEQMRLNIQSQAGSIPRESIEVYDVVLMVNVNGTGWVQADKGNFPASGLTVTLPYPQGTGKDTNDFVVCHLFTEDMNGHRAGDTEYPTVEKTAEGIRFKVYGLSPISVGWTKVAQVGDTTDPGTEESGSSSESQASAAAGSSPKTRDGSHMEWYLLSMVLSGGTLCGIFFWTRKRRRG